MTKRLRKQAVARPPCPLDGAGASLVADRVQTTALLLWIDRKVNADRFDGDKGAAALGLRTPTEEFLRGGLSRADDGDLRTLAFGPRAPFLGGVHELRVVGRNVKGLRRDRQQRAKPHEPGESILTWDVGRRESVEKAPSGFS